MRVALLALLVLLVTLIFPIRSHRLEGFSDMNITASVEEEVIRTYNMILQRDPTMDELKSVTKDIQQQNLNFYTLRLILVDSDEYQRMVKTQTNTVSPELLKMIAERDYLARIIKIYEEVFQKKIPSDLVLPYHDLYVHVFKNNDRLLRNMYLDDRYGTFETELLSSINLDRDQLFAIYDRIYGMKEVPSSSWMPVAPLDADIEKNKFRLTDGREIWYKGLPSAPEPQPFYQLQEGSVGTNVSDWSVNDAIPGDLVIPPWRDRAPMVETETSPMLPPTTPPPPVTVTTGVPGTPQAPLQSGLGSTSLSTSPLTVSPSLPSGNNL